MLEFRKTAVTRTTLLVEETEPSTESGELSGQQKEATSMDVEDGQNKESADSQKGTPQSRTSDVEQFDTPMEAEEEETGSATMEVNEKETEESDLKETSVERTEERDLKEALEIHIDSVNPSIQNNETANEEGEEEETAVENIFADRSNDEAKEESDEMKPAAHFDDKDADELMKHTESLDGRFESPFSQPGHNSFLCTQPEEAEEDMKPAAGVFLLMNNNRTLPILTPSEMIL